MGGPMNVYEHTAYPWLLDEDILIRNCLKERVPILGICLGSQLLAKAANSKVKAGHAKEIGWRPIRLDQSAEADPVFAGMEEEFSVFHWHGDTFDLPDGATLLASSEMYANQAFCLNQNCYAFQFHIEVTETMIQEWCAAYPDDLKAMHFSEASIPVGCVECQGRITPLHERARRIFLNYFRHIHLI
jgi:GMP synthase (glutamine-hydrolysing)